MLQKLNMRLGKIVFFFFKVVKSLLAALFFLDQSFKNIIRNAFKIFRDIQGNKSKFLKGCIK